MAITGIGVISPIGCSIASFWTNLLDAKCAITMMEDEDPRLSGNRFWAPVTDDFLDQDVLPRTALRSTDRFTQYAMIATAQALRHAALNPPERTAVIVGNTMGGFPTVTRSQTDFIKGSPAVTPKLMALVIPNMAAALIAMQWKLHGPQLAISTACASSLDAVGLASGMIERGEIDAAIAGGTETLLTPLVYESLVRAGALSRATDVTRASRPFDAERDGFVMGDGAAILVLERMEFAARRGAAVLGRIRGYGSVADAYHITSPDPAATYEVAAMRTAMERAGNVGNECRVVYAHATGTVVGDAAEARAINHLYAGSSAIVTSIKGHLGHSMASAGATCMIAGIKGMHESVIPPTIGTQRLDPDARFDLVMTRPRRHPYSAFQVNAFGFGGQNASLVVSM